MTLPSVLTPDFGLLFWTLLAFGILLVVLSKFVFPIILGAVENRKEFIEESLKNARAANEQLAQMEENTAQMLRKTREEQAEILKSASEIKTKIIEEAKKEAQLESKKIIEEAKKQIQIEQNKALKEVRGQVAELSIQIAEKLLGTQLETPAQQESLIDRTLDDLLKS